VINGLEKGKLKPIIDRVLPFDKIVDAHHHLQETLDVELRSLGQPFSKNRIVVAVLRPEAQTNYSKELSRVTPQSG
jgi:hypothetical protein